MALAHAVYVYCLLRAGRRPSRLRLPRGLPEGARLALTPVVDDLFLVTSEVPLSVYGPANLEPRLRNLEWVSEVALAHERVVEHFTGRRGVTVVPMKMFSMFSSIEKALQDVLGRRRPLGRVFRRIAECEEWGIRVTRARPNAGSADWRKRRLRSTASSVSGAQYLAARKAARDAAPAARAASRAAADAAFARLRRLARDARRREEQQDDPGSAPPLLEAAFLVPSGARAKFKQEVRRQAASCAAAGASMVLTGPWPAYNFVAGDGS